jgi:hypothetical protein
MTAAEYPRATRLPGRLGAQPGLDGTCLNAALPPILIWTLRFDPVLAQQHLQSRDIVQRDRASGLAQPARLAP